MTGATHASIGAALGAVIKRPALAFAAGTLSHIIADAVPHRDLRPRIEIPLATAVICLVAARCGLSSPQFWGALGAVAPDFEHGLVELGLIQPWDELFHGHLSLGDRFGGMLGTGIGQSLLLTASLLTAEGR